MRRRPPSSVPPGMAELHQAAELADTVAGSEGLDWLMGRVTGEFDLRQVGPPPAELMGLSNPFDPEITKTLDELLHQARDRIVDPRGMES